MNVEHLKRTGCEIKIETDICRTPDEKETTVVEIIPDAGWKLKGSAINTVIEMSIKEVMEAVNNSDMDSNVIEEVNRLIKEVTK